MKGLNCFLPLFPRNYFERNANDLLIADNANPDFNRMEYAEKSLQKIKELENA